MQPVPYLNSWKRLLAQRHGAEEASLLAERIRQRYVALQDHKQPAATPSQRKRLNNLILPGLALYQAIRESNLSQVESLAETERLFEATLFTNERRFSQVLNRLPDPFPALRILLLLIERSPHTEAEHELIEDNPGCFAFNVHRCYLAEALIFYQAPELTPLYCKTDDWIAAAMPKVRWLRTKTIGGGDQLCDFRWERD